MDPTYRNAYIVCFYIDNKMHWLIIGSGWIGSKLSKLIQQLYPSDSVTLYKGSHLRSTESFNELKHFLQSGDAVDRIMDCMGRTSGGQHNNIDFLQENLKCNIQDNLLSHLLLMEIAQQMKIHLSIIGTGCIYQDGPDTPFDGFNEQCDPNFFGSDYSIVKGALDQMIRLRSQEILHVRIRMPIDDEPHKRNLITKLSTFAKVTDIPNSMSVLPDLLPILIHLAHRRVRGVFNLVNPGTMTHKEIMELYKLHVNQCHTVDVFPISEHDQVVKAKRSNTTLSTKQLMATCRENGIPEPLPLREALLSCLKQYSPYRCIAVTGGSGFLGSHLIDKLSHYYPRSTIINIDKNKSRFEIPNIICIQADITDSPSIQRIFERYEIDTVFHLAAETHVDKSFQHSMQFTRTNVEGTHVILECCRAFKVSRVIHMSTDEVYGSNTGTHTEQSLLNPTNPYAASKVGAEALCQAYIRSFKLPLLIVRCNNIYGTRQFPDKVIPRFICRALCHKPLQIQGDGQALRTFVHVHDVVSALHVILRAGVTGEIYNISSDDEWSVRALADRILKAVPGTIEFVADRNFQDVRYSINSEKLKALGWRPTVPFEDGLLDCITWYRNDTSSLIHVEE